MSIEIPWTRIARVTMRQQLFSGNQEGALGGWTLPVPRSGDRFAADVATTQFRQDAEGRRFGALLFLAATADARIAIHQPDLTRRASAGRPVVDGAEQAGSTLRMRALTPGTAFVPGQFFNVIHQDVRFTYMVAAQAITGADGRVALPIWPMLRFLTVDGTACDFDRPMIEGRLVGFGGAAMAQNRREPLQFAIEERG